MKLSNESKQPLYVLFAAYAGNEKYSVRVSQMKPNARSMEVEIDVANFCEWLFLTGRKFHYSRVQDCDFVLLGNVKPKEVEQLGFTPSIDNPVEAPDLGHTSRSSTPQPTDWHRSLWI
jgi:hypothetical protein